MSGVHIEGPIFPVWLHGQQQEASALDKDCCILTHIEVFKVKGL